ncbi:MAG: sigma-70 family RNA polymerase sigma factor [Polyangiales bacterium]
MLRSLWNRVTSKPAATAAAPTFTQIYEENVDAIWRALRRLGVHESQLEDAVQDVFLVLHRRAGEFEHRSSLRTWLFGIAHRVASDYRRAARRKGTSVELDEHIDDAAGPDEHVARAQAQRLVLAALDQLDEDKRLVFYLAELEQQPVVEIADALAINRNTAYTRLRLARAEFEAAITALRGGAP